MVVLSQGLTPLANDYRPFGTEQHSLIRNSEVVKKSKWSFKKGYVLLSNPDFFIKTGVFEGLIQLIHNLSG
jgi:hypothetical protein